MQDNQAWSWSEAFSEAVDVFARDPLSEWKAQRDWPEHRQRLACWRKQVESARQSYREGHREALGVLYDYWRTIAEDVKDQARFASETYRELRVRIKSAR